MSRTGKTSPFIRRINMYLSVRVVSQNVVIEHACIELVEMSKCPCLVTRPELFTALRRPFDRLRDRKLRERLRVQATVLERCRELVKGMYARRLDGRLRTTEFPGRTLAVRWLPAQQGQMHYPQ